MGEAVMVFRFGPFELDAATGELRRGGLRLHLEPQPARALTLLVERRGQLVTRDELRRHLWGDDVHVDFERGLAYAIGQVRAVLGESAERPVFVETLPRRGFRLIAPVTVVPGDAGVNVSEAAPLEAGTSGARRWLPFGALAVLAILAILAIRLTMRADDRPTIAVAAFDNETSLATYDTFVAGVSDAVVAALVDRAGDRLGVIGNEAVLRRDRSRRDLAAIERETGAEYVVLGQLQNDDAGLRVLAHLIRLSDGTHVWAHRFVRPLGALTGLEREVGLGVTEAVIAHVLAADDPDPHR
jgi:DNA-binding winged helix-turn-helix (wHTH) protein/TolB-like protein